MGNTQGPLGSQKGFYGGKFENKPLRIWAKQRGLRHLIRNPKPQNISYDRIRRESNFADTCG